MISTLAHRAAEYEAAVPANEFRLDVLKGLAGREKSLPCKYFYDETGSNLFERICGLPEYYLTRAELGILRRSAEELADLLGPHCLLIEFGSSSGLKTRMLLDHLIAPTAYVPIDVAREQLRVLAQELTREYPGLEVRPICADFTRLLSIPEDEISTQRRVVYFPGSTIGNFTPDEAVHLLLRTAELCGRSGGLLLGADLKKDPRLLDAAYNDSQGVTAAFNLNLLHRINCELMADFGIEDFWHHAFYNASQGRIEMYLVSRLDQRVRVAGHTFYFAEGESVCTEYSYKYTFRELQDLAAAAGFAVERIWVDEQKLFSVLYFTAQRC
ncbi:MAG TPA: L-histidine N(alpha)-methyltransferase [Phycisphaerae bacterium]|nr:L-histidine N(alpha)-methyltransferase [Phycisphaerae bacterium]